MRRWKTALMMSAILAGVLCAPAISHAAFGDQANGCDVETLYLWCGAHWSGSHLINFTYDPTGAPANLPAGQVAGAVRGAMHQWNLYWPGSMRNCGEGTATLLCYRGTRVSTPTFDSYGDLMPDGANEIRWGDPSICEGVSSSALAVTCTWHDASDPSRIVESDIVLNPDADWAVIGNPIGDVGAAAYVMRMQSSFDLQSALTHEFGHVIGLKHIGTESWPVDLTNAGDASQAQQAMYRFQRPGSTSMRTLGLGDIAGELRIASA